MEDELITCTARPASEMEETLAMFGISLSRRAAEMTEMSHVLKESPGQE